jgi:hypothetical protein
MLPASLEHGRLVLPPRCNHPKGEALARSYGDLTVLAGIKRWLRSLFRGRAWPVGDGPSPGAATRSNSTLASMVAKAGPGVRFNEHLSLLASLGTRTAGPWAYGTAYAAGLRKALRQATEERFCRCRGKAQRNHSRLIGPLGYWPEPATHGGKTGQYSRCTSLCLRPPWSAYSYQRRQLATLIWVAIVALAWPKRLCRSMLTEESYEKIHGVVYGF